MPLRIIKGPPNSGRTELLRRQYVDSLPRNPVLVVPATEHIFAWEERLTREKGAFLGGRVMHFRDLVSEVLTESPDTGRPVPGRDEVASALRRRAITSDAMRESWPFLADRIEHQPGLVDAALRLVDELRENLVDPDTLDRHIRDADGRVPAELGALYRTWITRLDEAGLVDLPGMGMAAASAPVSRWEGRPVFVTGFDDFTEQQLTLLTRLATVCDVTVAVTHEPDNRAMVVPNILLGRLLNEGAAVIPGKSDQPRQTTGRDPALFSLERDFLNREADGSLDPSGPVHFIESAGHRGEAEHVGARIARLVADGTNPGQIAIAVDQPAVNGPVFRDVLAGYDLPVTLQSETPASGTAVGRAALNLLRAVSPVGDTDDLFAFARAPLGLDREAVDRIELETRRAGITLVDEAAGRFRRDRSAGMLPGWDEARKGDVTGAVRLVTELVARNLLRGDIDISPGSIAAETAMTTALGEACDELDAIGSDLSAGDLSDLLLGDTIKVWAVPAAGTITIASPYSMRAKRFEHLFMVSLQERSIGDDGGGPFLTAAARTNLGLPKMTDPEDQDIYLFHTSLAVPTRSLTLSSRTADVHGKTELPSPLIAEVKRLFRDPGGMTERRKSEQIVFPPAQAPSVDELARSLAAGGKLSEGTGSAPAGIPGRLDLAAELDEATRRFGPITGTAREMLARNNTLSASAIEAFIECPYRWFFENALRPVRFGPEPEHMARGILIHDVLAELYRRHTGQIPTPDDVHDWVAEASRIILDASAGGGVRLGTDSADHRIERQRVMGEISRYLFRESRRPAGGFRPQHFERGFGLDDAAEGEPLAALDLEGWSLRGRVDRIDFSPDGETAAVIDYKSGMSSCRSLAKMRRDGKVQLHLYARAVEELLDGSPEVVAALYVPICRGDGRPRGVLAAEGAIALADLNLFPKDVADSFGEEIERGVALAARTAARMLDGEIAHGPGACLDHFHHAGVPDWTLSAGDGSGSDR